MTRLLRTIPLRARLRQPGRAVQRIATAWRWPLARRVSPTRFAGSGPVAIAYDVRGRGAALVLIQGVGIGRWGWSPVADRLARRFQVITIDNRGIGASGSHSATPQIRTMAEMSWPSWIMPASSTPASSAPASASFLTSKAKLEQFVSKTLGPATLRRRPKVAERLAAAKRAHPQSERAWRAQAATRLLQFGELEVVPGPHNANHGAADHVGELVLTFLHHRVLDQHGQTG